MSELQAIFARRRRLLEEAEKKQLNHTDDNEEHSRKEQQVTTTTFTRDETSPDTVIQDDISVAPSASNTEEEGHTFNVVSCSEKDGTTSPHQPNNNIKVGHDDDTTTTTNNNKLDNNKVRLIMEKASSERAEYMKASIKLQEGVSNVTSVNDVDNGLTDTDVVKEEDMNDDNIDASNNDTEEEEEDAAVPVVVSKVKLQPSNKDPVGKDSSSRKQ